MHSINLVNLDIRSYVRIVPTGHIAVSLNKNVFSFSLCFQLADVVAVEVTWGGFVPDVVLYFYYITF